MVIKSEKSIYKPNLKRTDSTAAITKPPIHKNTPGTVGSKNSKKDVEDKQTPA